MRQAGQGYKVLLRYDQLDLSTGDYNSINKMVSLSIKTQVEVEMSPRKFINKDDHIGLFLSNPEPKTNLGMEGKPLLS